MILVSDGRTEQRHEAVTEKLVDGALVAVNLRERALEEPVEQCMHLLGPEAFGQPRGVDDVTEEDGHELVLAIERDPGCQAWLGWTVLDRVPTGSAKSLADADLGTAGRAPNGQARAAVLTEFRAVPAFSVAARAVHEVPPRAANPSGSKEPPASFSEVSMTWTRGGGQRQETPSPSPKGSR